MSRVLSVQSKLSKSRVHKQIKTSRSQQAYYINWMNLFVLKDEDPCEDNVVKKDAFLVVVKSLILGENIRASIVVKYVKGLNILH